MKRVATKEYIEKAKLLTSEQAEYLLARMGGKLSRKLEGKKLDPLEAAAIQLELEDEQLAEWRNRWAEIAERDGKKK